MTARGCIAERVRANSVPPRGRVADLNRFPTQHEGARARRHRNEEPLEVGYRRAVEESVCAATGLTQERVIRPKHALRAQR